MKGIPFTWLTACILLLATGCKKEPLPSAYCGVTVAPVVSYPIVKTSSSFGQFGWTTDGYEYDSAQRVLRAGTDFYCYNGDSVTSNLGVNYYLGTDGVAIGYGFGGTPVMNYVYDNNGYKVRAYHYNLGSVDSLWSYTEYTYSSDSNVVLSRQIAYDKYSGNHENTRVYTYYNYTNTIGNKNTGMAYLGKDSRNLVKTIFDFEYDIDKADTLEKYEYFFSYTFTPQGYVDSVLTNYIRYRPQSVINSGTKPPIVYTYY